MSKRKFYYSAYIIYFADFEIYVYMYYKSLHVYIFIGKITSSANIIILFYSAQESSYKHIKVIA